MKPGRIRPLAWACGFALLTAVQPLSVVSDGTESGPLRFRIRFGPEQSREPLDGRILLLISNDASQEPRFQIGEGPKTQLVFGIDVDGLKATTDPPYEGEVDYEPRAEHCWNGDHTRPNAISRLRYHQLFGPRIVQRILATAPTGGDVTSWRY